MIGWKSTAESQRWICLDKGWYRADRIIAVEKPALGEAGCVVVYDVNHSNVTFPDSLAPIDLVKLLTRAVD